MDIPVVQKRQMSMVQTAQKSAQIPQVQCLDKVNDIVTERQATVQSSETVVVPQVQFLDKVVHIPTVMQRQVPTIQAAECPCHCEILQMN